MAALLNKPAVSAKAATRASRPAVVSRTAVVVRAQAEDLTRRSALASFAGAAALLSGAAPSLAAYGENANVFGKVTNKSGFSPYVGEGFALLLPAKWNPSKEKDFPDVVLRYEDNFDAVNNLIVIKSPTDKKSIEDFGGLDKFLSEYSFLLGKQSYVSDSVSEGGFAQGKASAASLLNQTVLDRKGKPLYKYELLVRSADGDEGGRHQLIGATVSNGQLYIIKLQAGDKRWFKGTDKECRGTFDSFSVV